MKFNILAAQVESESTEGTFYNVTQTKNENIQVWNCTCLASHHFKVDCKHIKFMKGVQGEKKKLTKDDLINGTYATS